MWHCSPKVSSYVLVHHMAGEYLEYQFKGISYLINILICNGIFTNRAMEAKFLEKGIPRRATASVESGGESLKPPEYEHPHVERMQIITLVCTFAVLCIGCILM